MTTATGIRNVTRRNLLLALLFIAGVSWFTFADETPAVCVSMPLLATYEKAGMLQRTPDGIMTLQLVADLHTADCGAPDCYGTNIAIAVKPDAGESRCVIRAALVNTTDYFEEGCGPSERVEEHRRETYMPDEVPADLSNSSLAKLTLRNKDGTRAIVLLPDNFFYFDNVTRGGVLHTRLPNENDNEDACCWGATSSMKEDDL